MPIARRVSSPQSFEIKPKTPRPKPVIIDPNYVAPVFTESILDTLSALPSIGYIDDHAQLVYKYMIPNLNRWSWYRGWCLTFWPARGRARNYPEGHVVVLAIICQASVNERAVDQQPTLRLSDLDMSLWPQLVIHWLTRLDKHRYTPAQPVPIPVEQIVPPRLIH